MEIQQEILSDITVHMKYAKWREADQRKETWEEICQRNRQMHLDSVTKRGQLKLSRIRFTKHMITMLYLRRYYLQ